MWVFLRFYVIVVLFTCLASIEVFASGNLPDLNEPLIKQRADPWLLKHSDGYYYFIATAPQFDRIEIRRAKGIDALASAASRLIWRKHVSGPQSANIWAPELHRFDGQWIIYFAAGEAEHPGRIRMYALSNTSDNPMDGDWKEEGQIKTPWNSFALDATSFTHSKKHYLIWAEADGHKPKQTYNSALLLAELETPTKIKLPITVLSEPEYPWEKQGYKVNEGAAVIKRHGKIFVSYSGSATDHNYAMGLLWVEENADLSDAKNWSKSRYPVFYTNKKHQRYGPGHNSFTVAEDGITDLMVYHARSSKVLKGNPLSDPDRHTRIRELGWSKDGMPDFRQEAPDKTQKN